MIDYEAEYNNRARVPEHPAIIEGWARDAVAFRAGTPHEPGLVYGETPRARYDHFPGMGGAGPDAPVILFIHGGYWQALDRSFFSHMAAGPLARGYPVAVAGYDLCPECRLGDIVDQMRACALTLWRRTGRRVVPIGHSAGGHLVAMLLATEWCGLDPTAPADLAPAGLAISGLFELEPLIGTSVNYKLGLTPPVARLLSPALLTPQPGVRLDAFVGGLESREYLRQSHLIASEWARRGAATHYAEIPNANHFTVIAGLAEPDSVLTDALVRLATP